MESDEALGGWLSWNPTTGCDRLSDGCANCYALDIAANMKRRGSPKYQVDGDPRTSGPGFGLALHPSALDIPLRRKKPSRYFVNSMSDLFHARVPPDFIAQVFRRMAAADQHTYMVITKRTRRMAKILADPAFVASVIGDRLDRWPLPNLWVGVSIESSKYVWRADVLRATPAAVRFISAEPLLGYLDGLDLSDVDWVSCGGETGPHARPAHPDWFRQLQAACAASGTLFNLHSVGEWALSAPGPGTQAVAVHHGVEHMRHIGRWEAGRALDGQIYDQHPPMYRKQPDGFLQLF